MANIIYRDYDQSLKHGTIIDEQSVMASIHNILSTPKGTRLFNKEFGCDVDNILHDLMGPAAELALITEVISSINRWEPRAQVDGSNSYVTEDFNNNIYWLTLSFKIIGIDQSFQHKIGLSK